LKPHKGEKAKKRCDRPEIKNRADRKKRGEKTNEFQEAAKKRSRSLLAAGKRGRPTALHPPGGKEESPTSPRRKDK